MFIDFQSNFGTYRSTFSLSQLKNDESQQQEQLLEAYWPGKVTRSEQERMQPSGFQRELDAFDEEDNEEEYLYEEEKK